MLESLRNLSRIMRSQLHGQAGSIHSPAVQDLLEGFIAEVEYLTNELETKYATLESPLVEVVKTLSEVLDGEDQEELKVSKPVIQDLIGRLQAICLQGSPKADAGTLAAIALDLAEETATVTPHLARGVAHMLPELMKDETFRNAAGQYLLTRWRLDERGTGYRRDGVRERVHLFAGFDGSWSCVYEAAGVTAFSGSAADLRQAMTDVDQEARARGWLLMGHVPGILVSGPLIGVRR